MSFAIRYSMKSFHKSHGSAQLVLSYFRAHPQQYRFTRALPSSHRSFHLTRSILNGEAPDKSEKKPADPDKQNAKPSEAKATEASKKVENNPSVSNIVEAKAETEKIKRLAEEVLSLDVIEINQLLYYMQVTNNFSSAYQYFSLSI